MRKLASSHYLEVVRKSVDKLGEVLEGGGIEGALCGRKRGQAKDTEAQGGAAVLLAKHAVFEVEVEIFIQGQWAAALVARESHFEVVVEAIAKTDDDVGCVSEAEGVGCAAIGTDEVSKAVHDVEVPIPGLEGFGRLGGDDTAVFERLVDDLLGPGREIKGDDEQYV